MILHSPDDGLFDGVINCERGESRIEDTRLFLLPEGTSKITSWAKSFPDSSGLILDWQDGEQKDTIT